MLTRRTAASSAAAVLLRARRRAACSANTAAWRCLSSDASSSESSNSGTLVQLVSLETLAHQSRVLLQIADATTAARVRVVPALQQSEFALRVFGAADGAAAAEDVFELEEVEREESSGQLKVVRLSATRSVPGGAMDVLMSVPHLVDLDISVVRGSVSVADKIEGNVRVVVSDGDIAVNKLRGEQIQLKTNRGRVDVKALVEGETVKMAASTVSVKRLMAASTEIKLAKGTENSDLGAIYSSLCLVNSQSTGALNVGNIHGFLRVNGDEMSAVSVRSVNGALHIEDSGAGCNVDAHFDAWSPEAANKIFVGGDVRVSLDPSAPIDLELHGNKIATGACTFGDHELDHLDEDYAIFTGSLLATVAAPTSGAGASGKVNIGSAKTSALRTSFFAVENNTSEQGSTSASSDIHPASLPRLVVHASNGAVTVEQLDWMGTIKRKHLTK